MAEPGEVLQPGGRRTGGSRHSCTRVALGEQHLLLLLLLLGDGLGSQRVVGVARQLHRSCCRGAGCGAAISQEGLAALLLLPVVGEVGHEGREGRRHRGAPPPAVGRRRCMKEVSEGAC
jgi:hypothetical protein